MSWREELTIGKAYIEQLFIGTYPGSELSGTELGYLDGVVAGTAQASKALVLDASADLTSGINDFYIDGDLYVEGGSVEVGEEGAQVGGFVAYGSPTGNTQGGSLSLMVADDNDTTIANYLIQASSDDLLIGPVTDTDALQYNAGTSHWNVNADVYSDSNWEFAGVVALGTVQSFTVDNVTSEGILTLAGAPTGSVEGGKVKLETGDDHDASINAYWLEADGADFWISPDGSATEQFGYRQSGANWEFDSASPVYFDCPLSFGQYLGNHDVGDGSSAGTINLKGAATGSTAGGEIRFYTADDYDTTNNYFSLSPVSAALTLQKADGTDIFEITESTINFTGFPVYTDRTWTFAGSMSLSGATIGNFTVGDAETTGGAITLAGGATAQTQGGSLKLETADDHDTTVFGYEIEASSDDLVIWSDQAADVELLRYRQSGTYWEFSADVYGDANYWDLSAATVNLPAPFSVNGTSVTATGAELNYLDITTLGVPEASKALTLSAGGLCQWQSGQTLDLASEGATINIAGGAGGNFQIDSQNMVASAAELNTKEFTVKLDDLSGAATAYIACPVAGTVTRIDTVVTGDPGADSTITMNVNGGTVMSNPVTIANGSAAGTRDTAAPGTNNTVAVGDAIYVINDATPTNAVSAYVTVTVTL